MTVPESFLFWLVRPVAEFLDVLVVTVLIILTVAAFAFLVELWRKFSRRSK